MRRLEKHIESDIKAALETLGFNVTKTSAARHAKGVTAGTPDLYVRHDGYGLRFWAEIKQPGKNPTAVQLAWHNMEWDSGGEVYVWRCNDDMLATLRMLGVLIT